MPVRLPLRDRQAQGRGLRWHVLGGCLCASPLAVGAGSVWLTEHPASIARISLWAIIYAATTVAVLGGIRAGAALGPYTAGHVGREFGIAGLSFMAAMAVLLLPPLPAISLLIAALMLQALSDMAALQRTALPRWYGHFRLSLAGVAISSLLVILVRLLTAT